MSVPGSASRRATVGLVVAIAVGTAGLLVSPTATVETLESLAADPVLFGLVVAGLYAVRPLLSWPTTPLAVVVGYGYGVALGVPIALAGTVATVVPVFLAVRWFAVVDADSGPGPGPGPGPDPGPGSNLDPDPEPEPELEDAPDATTRGTERRRSRSEADIPLFERALERTGDAVARYYEAAGPIRGVTASRLAPIPSGVSTCAAAVSGVRLRQFVLGTALGELPWAVAAVVVGSSAATITTNGLDELGLELSIACGLAAAALLAGPAYRVVRTRRATREQDSSASYPPDTTDS